MRYILVRILRMLSRQVLARYQPIVIGITGSVGKTTAKEALYAVLHRSFHVRKSVENINNEIGIPLTILGLAPAGTRTQAATLKTRFALLWGIIKSISLAFGLSKAAYPDVLILELGADRPGDIAYLAEMIRPQIAIVTAVGTVPVHVEYYPDAAAVAKEKAHILDYIGTEGLAVLNQDDPVVFDMKHKLRGKVVTFGFNNHADLWASDLSYYMGDGKFSVEGLSFKLHRGESFIPLRLPAFIAAHQVYAVMAATAVGIHFGLNLVDIGAALEHVELPRHRLELLSGADGAILIDDTYNASPLSMRAALDTLKDFSSTFPKNAEQPRRRIAVLGDMLELGDKALESHREIGNLLGDKADYLVTVGKLGAAIAETARPKMHESRVWSFDTAREAIGKLRELIQAGDVVLIKGSRAMHMDLIVDALRQK